MAKQIIVSSSKLSRNAFAKSHTLTDKLYLQQLTN